MVGCGGRGRRSEIAMQAVGGVTLVRSANGAGRADGPQMMVVLISMVLGSVLGDGGFGRSHEWVRIWALHGQMKLSQRKRLGRRIKSLFEDLWRQSAVLVDRWLHKRVKTGKAM